MEKITQKLLDVFDYLASAGVADIADIVIVAVLIYELLVFIKRTNSSKVARGLLVLLLVLGLSQLLRLNVVNFLLRRAFEIGLLAIVILFQPEIRRALERMGASSRLGSLFGRDERTMDLDAAITQTVIACTEMSKAKVGALILFERVNDLNDQMSTGTIVDAETTAELLKTIFFPKSPLHDGAVIIKHGRVAAAACMLPMSGNMNLSRDLGMRHRAGIGMSEKSDAVIVIVSEETGSISVAMDGMLKRHLSTDIFEKILRNELLPEPEEPQKGGIFAKLTKVKKNGG